MTYLLIDILIKSPIKPINSSPIKLFKILKMILFSSNLKDISIPETLLVNLLKLKNYLIKFKLVLWLKVIQFKHQRQETRKDIINLSTISYQEIIKPNSQIESSTKSKN